MDIRDRALYAGLEYVYIGNIRGVEFESTRCPRYRKMLIARRNYRVKFFNLDGDGGVYMRPRCAREYC
ncbi:MAG: hypothetical protein QXO22_07240 [Thermosphaera sp.]